LKKTNLKKGFSLLEIIFIISILGIIAAVAVPKLLDSRSSAIVTTIKQDITTITTSVQSYYMLNGKIDKITDSVNLNPNTWDVTDKKLEYKINDVVCTTIEIDENKLIVGIDETTSDTCKKLYDSGIRDETYELL